MSAVQEKSILSPVLLEHLGNGQRRGILKHGQPEQSAAGVNRDRRAAVHNVAGRRRSHLPLPKRDCLAANPPAGVAEHGIGRRLREFNMRGQIGLKPEHVAMGIDVADLPLRDDRLHPVGQIAGPVEQARVGRE
jgi:hypothetical protein